MSSMFDTDGDDTSRWVASWTATVDEQLRSSTDMAERVTQLRVTERSTDGAVEVTVDGGGVLTNLVLGEQVARWRPEEIAADIMATLRTAHQELARRVSDVVDETVGADSASGQVVADAMRARAAQHPVGTHGWYDLRTPR